MSTRKPKPEKGIESRTCADGTTTYRGHVWSARDAKRIRGVSARNGYGRQGAAAVQGDGDPSHSSTPALAKGSYLTEQAPCHLGRLLLVT